MNIRDALLAALTGGASLAATEGPLGDIIKRKKKEIADNNANPISRLGATFGLVDGVSPLSASDIYGGPATAEQENNIELVNQLLGDTKPKSFIGGLFGKGLAALGGGIKGLLNV